MFIKKILKGESASMNRNFPYGKFNPLTANVFIRESGCNFRATKNRKQMEILRHKSNGL